ncbi:EAL domain-containing protein [Paenibacillus sp. YYML68]|uniref:EAL domain-containing protein n=1 Tax=Paenibacillus sp. YYML68 TaxID=2909250 RepID=UPI00248F9D5D|nr:EAL domain-containing protein [Paenibacillus sp. YYML68]
MTIQSFKPDVLKAAAGMEPFARPAAVYNEQEGKLTLPYSSKEELLHSLDTLRTAIAVPDQEQLQLHIRKSEYVPEDERVGSIPLPLFFARMQHYDIVKIITDGQFTSYMQPIVHVPSQKLYGYEFLLRAASGGPQFKPYELFKVAGETGLHSFLDRSARISAIQTSAMHVRRGLKRFINFLPSSIYNPNYCLSHTFAAINRFSLDPNDFIFEVVETEQIDSIEHLQQIFNVYRSNGVRVALDDVGAGYATLDVLSSLQPDYVKIDRGLIDHCDESKEKQESIRDIMARARSFGALVLAEGLERPAEWEYCRQAGVDLAQGYLLGKPAPLPLEGQAWVRPFLS